MTDQERGPVDTKVSARNRSVAAPADRAPLRLNADPVTTAELGQVRLSEIQQVSDRLGRVAKIGTDRWFFGAATLLIGGAIGAAIGGIAITGDHVTLYWVVTGAVLAVGVVAGLGGFAVRHQRAEDAEAIKSDLDTLIGRYPAGPR